MKQRFILFRRGEVFYFEDTSTGKQSSLHTRNRTDALRVLHAKNEAQQQPALNLQIARAYLAGTDCGVTTRTWQEAFEALIASKRGGNQLRWQSALKDKAYDPIRHQVIIETPGQSLLQVLSKGTVSTNIYLRRLHNFCLDMDWLLKPIIPKRQWPRIEFKERRGITSEEHQRILASDSRDFVRPDSLGLPHRPNSFGQSATLD